MTKQEFDALRAAIKAKVNNKPYDVGYANSENQSTDYVAIKIKASEYLFECLWSGNQFEENSDEKLVLLNESARIFALYVPRNTSRAEGINRVEKILAMDGFLRYNDYDFIGD